MSSKKKWSILLMLVTVLFFLTACGSSAESKIVGSWKAVVGDKVSGYMEINEERYTVRSDGDTPMTAEYILTETQDDTFILEVVNPENGSVEFMFEGSFENNDKIAILGDSDDEDGKRVLMRVDSITEEMEKDEKKSQAQEKKEAVKEEQEKKIQEEKDKELAKEEAELQEEQEKELAQQEEKRLEEEKARELAQEEERKELAQEKEENQQTAKASGTMTYLQKANSLEDGIMTEAKKLFAHDLQPGFYGQYYSEWDRLLNEVWGELKTALSSTEFENLKQEQNEWINMKEQNFAEIPDEPASERARGMDYLAFETRDRTFYLIESYLE